MQFTKKVLQKEYFLTLIWFLLLVNVVSCLIKTSGASGHESVIVTTPTGQIRGHQLKVRNVRVYRYLGIPYAVPPTGTLRFKRPVVNPAFDPNSGIKLGLFNATHYCDNCIQDKVAGILMKLLTRSKMSENCLCLNIWTPVLIKEKTLNSNDASDNKSGTDLLPVLFYIHGGGFYLGSGSSHPGNYLAAKGSVIVTINYRLGPLGFFHSGNEESPGNQGLRDQILALKWVNDYIQYFGGDPKRITIAGQSAGAISVSDLLASPKTSGLFSSAILMTGSILIPSTFGSGNQLLDHSIELAIKNNCADEKSRLQIPDFKPKNVPVQTIKSDQAEVNKTEETTKGQQQAEEGEPDGNGQGQGQSSTCKKPVKVVEEEEPSQDGLIVHGMNNQIMECLRKLRPSKFILQFKGSKAQKKVNKQKQSNPFSGTFAFHPMGDSDILPTRSPYQLINESMSDPNKKNIRLLIGTTDYEGAFFRLVPVTKALAKKFKSASNQEWKSFMRVLIKGELNSITDEDLEKLVSMYFDPPSNTGINDGNRGVTSNESDWHLYNFFQFHGDLSLYCPTWFEAEIRSSQPETVMYAYYFRYVLNKVWNPWKSPHGVPHGMETPFFFGGPFNRKTRLLFNDKDRQVSDTVMNIVTKFIHGSDLDWPRFDSVNRSTLSIDDKIQVIKQVNTHKCSIFNLYLKNYTFN